MNPYSTQIQSKWPQFEAAAYQKGMTQQEAAEKWTDITRAYQKIKELLKPIMEAFASIFRAAVTWFEEITQKSFDPIPKKKEKYNWQVPFDTTRGSQVFQVRPAYAMRKGIHRK